MPKAKKPKPKAKMPELLPCPFCGAAPVAGEFDQVVTCANPDCLVQPETNTLTLAGARKAWNRRAP